MWNGFSGESLLGPGPFPRQSQPRLLAESHNKGGALYQSQNFPPTPIGVADARKTFTETALSYTVAAL